MNSRLQQDPKTGQAAFDELTANLEPKRLQQLRDQIAALPAELQSDQRLAKQILEGRWETLFAENQPHLSYFPLQALRCVRRGFLSAMTFSTSQMFYNCFQHARDADSKPRIVSVYEVKTGQISEKAKNMITATMRIFSTSQRIYSQQKADEIKKRLAKYRDKAKDNSDNFDDINLQHQLLKFDTSDWEQEPKVSQTDWDAEAEQKFYDILAALPRAEQRFLVVPDPYFHDGKFESRTSVIVGYNFDEFNNSLSRFRLNQQQVCMVPSRGMMAAHAAAVFGTSAPNPVIRLGALSTGRALHAAAISGGREMYQGFQPLADLAPDKIDGFAYSQACAEAELHDRAHVNTIAYIPANEQKLFLELAEFLFKVAETEEKSREYAESVASHLSDLDFPGYSPNYFMRLPAILTIVRQPFFQFWMGVDDAAQIDFWYGVKSEQRLRVARHLAHYLLDHQSELYSKYGLKLDSLAHIELHERDIMYILHVLMQVITERLTPQLPADDLVTLANYAAEQEWLLRTISTRLLQQKILENLVESVTLAFRHQCGYLRQCSAEVISGNFHHFCQDGKLVQLRDNQPEAFNYVMSLFPNTSASDDYLQCLQQQFKQNPETFYLKHIIYWQLESSMTMIFSKRTTEYLKCLTEVLEENFAELHKSNVLNNIKLKQRAAFQYCMFVFRRTRAGDRVLQNAVTQYREDPSMFNLLYDRDDAALITASGHTLADYAAAAENSELARRLKLDGVKGSCQARSIFQAGNTMTRSHGIAGLVHKK